MAIKFYYQQSAPYELDPQCQSFEEELLVDLTNAKESFEVIKREPQFPKRFETHRIHNKFYLIDAKLDQDKTIPNVRVFRLQWSTRIPDALIRNGKPVYYDDPIARPISVNSGFYTIPRTKRMCFGKVRGSSASAPTLPTYDPKQGVPIPKVPIVTSAGEPIFMQIEDEVRVFSCQKNVLRLPLFMGKGGTFINSDAIRFQGLDFKPLELLICHIRLSEPRFEYGTAYYIFNFDLMVAPDDSGWCDKRRDAGFHEKVVVRPGGNAPEQAYLKAITVGPIENLQPPSQPVLLTAEGRAYRNPGVNQTNATPQKDRTGPILSTEGRGQGGVGLTDQDFEDAELKFYNRLAIPFKKWVPLT